MLTGRPTPSPCNSWTTESRGSLGAPPPPDANAPGSLSASTVPLQLTVNHLQSPPHPQPLSGTSLHLHSNWSPGSPPRSPLRDCVSPHSASHRPGGQWTLLRFHPTFTPLFIGPLNAPTRRPTPSDLTVNPPFSQAIRLTHIPDSLSILGFVHSHLLPGYRTPAMNLGN